MVLALGVGLGVGLSGCGRKAEPEAAASASAAASAPRSAPALTVEVTTLQPRDWDLTLSAHGPIAAWQEAIVGAELGGQRLIDVKVDVGDTVHKGQVLAVFSSDAVGADEQAAQASAQETEALAAEARANADRTRKLLGSGALSPQDAQRSLTAEATAQAKAAAAKAQLATQRLRLRQTQVLAPDDGVISARSATVGAVGQAGQELFRLVRQGRLQWRAEVAAADLPAVRAGQVARINVPGVPQAIEGRVKVASPTVDAQTRNGIVYIDLPASVMGQGVRPGMYASGTLAMGRSRGMTLPQTAIALLDGFHQVYVLDGQTVHRTKVQVGRREGDRIEVTGGLPAQARVVAAGVGLLADGDTVKVVDQAPPLPQGSTAAGAAR